MVILSKIICNSVLKQYWEYRISRAKAINIDLISQNINFIITVRTLQGLWYFTTTLCNLCIYRDYFKTFKLLKNMPFFYILYILIKKILKILYWGRNLQGRTGKGPKPLGGRTGKGPKPLAFTFHRSDLIYIGHDRRTDVIGIDSQGHNSFQL